LRAEIGRSAFFCGADGDADPAERFTRRGRDLSADDHGWWGVGKDDLTASDHHRLLDDRVFVRLVLETLVQDLVQGGVSEVKGYFDRLVQLARLIPKRIAALALDLLKHLLQRGFLYREGNLLGIAVGSDMETGNKQ